MSPRRRRELFPTDRGLTARMLAAAVMTPAVLAAALVALVAFAPLKIVAVVAVAAAIGIYGAVHERAAAARGHEVEPSDAPELHAIVERLCVVADLAKPRIVVEDEQQPNSWIVSLGRGRSRLHVTEGLLDRLEWSELEAVIGHELAHVAHRDAAVMTVVGGPGAVLLGGGMRVMRSGGWWFPQIGGAVAIAIGWLGSVGTRALSRYREFAADAGAVALTGNPAALATALMKVSDGVMAVPSKDLRAVAARDPFHLLPVARPHGWKDGPPLPATHPSLQARIARLERLESKLQAAR
jgi:heat shock protein HtpX